MLFRILAETKKRFPEKTALVYGLARLTYREIYEKTIAFSNGLLALALTPSDTVALLLPNTPEFVVSFYALARLNIGVVTLNPLLSAQELTGILQENHVRFIIATAKEAALCSQIIASLVDVLPIEVIVVEEISGYSLTFSRILALGNTHSVPEKETEPLVIYDENDAFLYQYSSGSTGKAKRVARTQQNLVCEAQSFLATTHLTEVETILCVVPLFHAHGLGNGMLAAIGSGGTLILLERVIDQGREEPFLARCQEVLDIIVRERVTILPGSPYIFLALAESVQETSTSLSNVRLCFSAGNFLPQATFDLFFQRFGIPVRQLYGCTEAGSVTMNLEEGDTFHPNSIGLPFQNNSVLIVDEEGKEVFPGIVGELAIKSNALTSGYCDASEINSRIFRDGFFFTGDLGKQDSQGLLYLTGRKRLFIDTGGRKVDPFEIQEVLARYPKVVEVAVVGVESPYGGELIKAVVVVNQICSEQELIEHCQLSLVFYQIPRVFEFRKELPYSPLGKLLRKELAVAPSSTAFATEASALRESLRVVRSKKQRQTLLRRYLQQLFADFLYLDPSRVSINQPLGELGLDSISAVEIRGRLESAFHLPLSPTIIWAYPTIARLSIYIAERLEVSPSRQPPSPSDFVQTDTLLAQQIEQMEPDEVHDRLNFYLSEQPAHFSPGKKLLLALNNLQQKQNSSGYANYEPVAIIGMGCRFPGGVTDPETFWDLLHEQRDGVGEVPPSRWNIDEFFDNDPNATGKMSSRWGGFLEQVDRFDPSFFGISPREAISMDPQQRLLLEVAWEALEHGEQVVPRLAGSRTGVFLGISTNDYLYLHLSPENITDSYLETGNRNSFAAGRLSYLLDLHGPCLTIDTACSSSLVALHVACQSLRNHECQMALAGGVNLILSPLSTAMTSKLHALSPDGHCQTLDARANGFVRSEGCGVVVLKRLSDALAAGDPILALVRGSAVNQDGRSSTLTAPNGSSQQEVIRQALADARLSAERIGYVELHGTGTALGDPIEVNALSSILAPGRSPEQTCVLGAVKTNIGHGEAAAGIAGLIKAVLVLQHEKIPANLHFQTLNPHIILDRSLFVIPTNTIPWPADPLQHRYAGISSFGLSGTNSHVILEEAPHHKVNTTAPVRSASLLFLSARTPAALLALVEIYKKFIHKNDEKTLYAICSSAAQRRTHYEERVVLLARTHDECLSSLEAFLKHLPDKKLMRATTDNSSALRKIAFVFSGQGTQYSGMGMRLMAQEEVFRAQLQECDTLLRNYVSWSLLDELCAPEDSSRLGSTEIAQPALFAIQVSLAALWRSWGIEPDAVIGHSVGEIAAAYVAGVLSLEAALHLVVSRGRLMQEATGKGAMLVVELSPQELETRLLDYQEQVVVGAYNSPLSTVLSGERLALENIALELQLLGVFSRFVPGDLAFHSPQMAPFQQRLEEDLLNSQNWQPGKTFLPFFSTVLERQALGKELDVAYWGRNLREPVRFTRAFQRLLESGYDCFVELGPHPVLQHALLQTCQTTFAGQTSSVLIVGSLNKNEEDDVALLRNLGMLAVHGITVEWSALYPRLEEHIALPTYPFQRESFWQDGLASRAAAWPHMASDTQHQLLSSYSRSSLHLGTHSWEMLINPLQLPYLLEHRIQGSAVLPGTVYLEAVLAAGRQIVGRGTVKLEQLQIHQMLYINQSARTEHHFQLVMCPGNEPQQICFKFNKFEAPDTWTAYASGTVLLDKVAESFPVGEKLMDIRSRCSHVITKADVYARFAEQGLEYGPYFQGIEQLWFERTEALARIQLPKQVWREAASYQCHPAFLDACLQIAATLSRASNDWLYLPVAIEAIQFVLPDEKLVSAWSHVRLHRPEIEGANEIQGETLAVEIIVDISLYNQDGALFASLHGLHLRRMLHARQSLRSDWLYNWQWKRKMRDEQRGPLSPMPGRWLIVAHEKEMTRVQLLRTYLETYGVSCTLVWLGADYQHPTEQEYYINPASLNNFQKVLINATASLHRPYQGIILFSSPATYASVQKEVSIDFLSQSTLHLIQAVLRMGWRDMPRLYFITCDAQVIENENNQIESVAFGQVMQSASWGIQRTLLYEHPELRSVYIDLCKYEGDISRDEDLLNALLEELSAPSGEEALALRGERRYVARLTPGMEDTIANAPDFFIHSDGLYLITGGMGGLGLQVANWLVEQGARSLVLVGRHPPDEKTLAVLSNLREKGAEVEIVTADVAEKADIEHLFYQLRLQDNPLRGVIHAAGILDDGMLLTQTWERVRGVIQPKLLGAWYLHEQTLVDSLDFFVLFSSAASLLGSPGQGGYAAANACLDDLARMRRRQGLPALSINWGPWDQVGMAAASINRGERLAQRGMSSIQPLQGLALLQVLLSQTSPQVGVLPLNIRQWCQFYPAMAHSSFFSDLAAQVAGGEAAFVEKYAFRERLQQAAPAEYTSLIETYLRETLARLLYLSPAQIGVQAPLSSIGVDSLIAMELRNHLENDLELVLPGTLVWGYPTLALLTTFLLTRLQPAPAISMDSGNSLPAERNGSETRTNITFLEIDQLSDAEAEGLLEQTLDELERDK